MCGVWPLFTMILERVYPEAWHPSEILDRPCQHKHVTQHIEILSRDKKNSIWFLFPHLTHVWPPISMAMYCYCCCGMILVILPHLPVLRPTCLHNKYCHKNVWRLNNEKYCFLTSYPHIWYFFHHDTVIIIIDLINWWDVMSACFTEEWVWIKACLRWNQLLLTLQHLLDL